MTQARNNNNRLLTPELQGALKDFSLYSQDGKKKNARCNAIFYIGNVRWYILEGEPTGKDFSLYGIVLGLSEIEYGYVSLNEMAGISIDGSKFGLGILKVQQKRNFKPCRLAEIEDTELQKFLSRMYDKK